MKRLVIFDIDGTLTTTMTLDTEVFFAAVREILDIEQIDTDWSTYRDVTDVGVTTELIERRHGRPADPHEIDAVRRRFVALLDEAIATAPRAVPSGSGRGRDPRRAPNARRLQMRDRHRRMA